MDRAEPPKHLVLIFGPPAVGKMAVGMELAERTGLVLFHNHMSIEPVLKMFPFGSPPFNRLVASFRDRVFEEVAVGDGPGLIFTYVWALDQEGDRRFVDGLVARFEARGATVHFVELHAPQAERRRRNRTRLRLDEKPSKRDVEASERRLIENDAKFRLNTDGDFFYRDRHVRIDNTTRSAADVAEELVVRLGLPSISPPALVVEAFNDAISAGDLTRLGDLMTEDHTLVTGTEPAVRGRAACLSAWRRFFESWPDYRNVFERVWTEGPTVRMSGRSESADARLRGPAIWKAVVEGTRVREWHVEEDTPDGRRRLGHDSGGAP